MHQREGGEKGEDERASEPREMIKEKCSERAGN